MAADSDNRATEPSADLQVHLSPLLLGSLIAAGIATLMLAVATVYALREAGGPPPGAPLGAPPRQPPLVDVGLHLATAIFIIAWLTVVCAACRDHVLRRFETASRRVAALTVEYGELRDTEGYLRAMREAQAVRPADSPGTGRLRSVPPAD